MTEMSMTKRTTLATAGLLVGLAYCLAPGAVAAQTSADEAGVRRAAMDYLEGFYEGDTDKIRRGVHPEVVKFGFYPARDGAGYQSTPMSFAQMLEFATDVKESGEFPASDAPKEVILLEVQDQIAAAKVVAYWGLDYLHLAKYDGEWKIVQVLWQTPPPGH